MQRKRVFWTLGILGTEHLGKSMKWQIFEPNVVWDPIENKQKLRMWHCKILLIYITLNLAKKERKSNI